jgi:formate dehydrogenase subunit gamma
MKQNSEWIDRINWAERMLHWVVAILFLILLVTGLSLHVDFLRELLGSWRYHIREIHHYAGFTLMILPWLIVGKYRKQLAGFFKEMTQLRQVEVDWLAGRTKRAHKFNGGQKLNFLFSMIWILGLAGTGFFVWQPKLISNEMREFLFNWHKVLFYLITIQIAGHVFYACIYKPTRHALHGILRGKVKRDWAHEHHPLWIEEEAGVDEGTNTCRRG